MTVTPDIVTLAFPVFVKVAVSVLVLPTCTLPKLKLEEEELSDSVAEVPVPLRGIDIWAGEPLVLRVMVPLDGFAEVGANAALKFSEAPAAMVVEVVRPEMLKPDPLTFT